MADRFQIVAEALKAEMAKPYTYGSADCFFMGCRIADALDPSRQMVKTYSGSYKTLMGAQRALRKRGHKSLVTLYALHLEQIAPAFAALGDLAIVEVDGAEHVAVERGGMFRTKTEDGPRDYPVSAAKAAFRT